MMNRLWLQAAVLLLSTCGCHSADDPIKCQIGGFFRHPNDCTRFYRCVDITGGFGHYMAYFFNCPAGTVFDERVSVCNFPWASPPCAQETTGSEGGDEEEQEVGEEEVQGGEEGGDDSNVVIVTPQFSFECTAEGFFSHESDCQRFWLCKQALDEYELSPELYRCPDGYLFSQETRRCAKAEDVSCEKTPDLARIALEPRPIQLRIADLEGFFARNRFYN